jgi:hypothetical protein
MGLEDLVVVTATEAGVEDEALDTRRAATEGMSMDGKIKLVWPSGSELIATCWSIRAATEGNGKVGRKRGDFIGVAFEVDMETSNSVGRAAIHQAKLRIFPNKENNILESLKVGFAGSGLKLRETNKTRHQIRPCPESKVHETTEDRTVLNCTSFQPQSDQANQKVASSDKCSFIFGTSWQRDQGCIRVDPSAHESFVNESS